MATPKKYVNNVDCNARHHYDVFELIDDRAYHIAPFTQEYDAARVAEALAAADVLNEGAIHDSKYVVRARATVAHNIHRHDARSVRRKTKSIAAMRKRLADLLSAESAWMDNLPTKTSVGDDEIPEKPKKKKKIFAKKS